MKKILLATFLLLNSFFVLAQSDVFVALPVQLTPSELIEIPLPALIR